MLYIGVDLGTSAVKLLLMDETGDIKNIVSKEYPLFFPHPGWSEQNPEDWFEKSMEGIKELTEGFDRSKVAGISFGGQMHGLVALDKDDQVIRPAILWNDGRTGEETDYLNNVIGKDKLSQYTANIAFAGFTAPKILWMKKHEPENFAKIVKIMLPKDYLAYKLSGSFCTDVSDASGMLLMDVKNRCWSKEMMDICGITEEMLPKLYESYEVVGTLKEVSDENKLKFLLIHIKNTNPSQTYPLKEGSPITCINKDQANTLIATYFANAFSDVSILQYQEGESYQTPFKTDTGYCYQITENDLNITLPTTLTSMKLDKETNIYTLTFISENSNTVLTVTLKIKNNMKLIQEISYL